MPDTSSRPRLSVVMPTFNNERILRRTLASWERFGGPDVEIIVVEDGCRDGTAGYLDELLATPWGARQVRVLHERDAHELQCTNAGLAAARGDLVAAWQDDMFLQVAWLVPELLANFDAYGDIGMLALSRGLVFPACSDPIESWADLVHWRRLQSTIGPRGWNWIRLQEVDGVVRPWVVRRACVERVGALDPVFRPTEWDESDLAYRIRAAGWAIATHGYERDGAYFHLGSTTIGTPSPAYLDRVLRNGRIFHERWSPVIGATHARRRRSWMRRGSAASWGATAHALAARATGMLRSPAGAGDR